MKKQEHGELRIHGGSCEDVMSPALVVVLTQQSWLRHTSNNVPVSFYWVSETQVSHHHLPLAAIPVQNTPCPSFKIHTLEL